MKKHSALLIMLFIVDACLHDEAVAGPVTWAFEGEVTLFVDHNNLLGGEVGVGSPLSGFITFQSDAPGQGLYPGAILDISGSVGGANLVGPQGENHILAFNDIPFDNYSFFSDVQIDSTTAFFQISLRDTSGIFLSNADILVIPPAIEDLDLDGANFAIGRGDETLGINGVITTLMIVPDPPCGLLLTIGIVLFGIMSSNSFRIVKMKVG